MKRFGYVAAISLALVLAAGCGQGSMNFDVVAYHGEAATDPKTLTLTEPGAMVAQAVDEMDQSDPLASRFWAVIRRLPDLSGGIDQGEARAVVVMTGLLREGSKAERASLRTLIEWPSPSGGYNSPLQGLLWMIEAGDFSPSRLSRLTPEDCLDYAYRALPRRYPTPQAVLEYLRGHYSYVLDLYRFKSKRAFFRDKTGDCTEFTLLAGDILKRLGYRVEVMLSRPLDTGGHVTLVYQDQGAYWLLDASSAALTHMIGLASQRRRLRYPEKNVMEDLATKDPLVGPARDKAALVDMVNRLYGRDVPYKFISYEELDRAAETDGLEKAEWWRFG